MTTHKTNPETDNDYRIVACTPSGDKEILRTTNELMEIAIILQYCEVEYSILYREFEEEDA